MNDESEIRRWLHSAIVKRIITTFEVCSVLAAIVELCFGGPGIFVGGAALGLIGLEIGLLTE